MNKSTEQARSLDSKPAGLPVVFGAVVVVFVLIQSIVWGVNPNDEAWSLQVADRLLSGDVLFRDVRVGMLPLSFYLLALPMKVFASTVLVGKVAVALSAGVSAGLGTSILLRLEVSRTVLGLFVAGIVVFGMPAVAGLYNPLSVALLIATSWASLRWRRRLGTARSGRTALLVGVLAGCCFAVKISLGAAVAAAVAMVFIGHAIGGQLNWHRLTSTSILAACGFLGVLGVVVVPIVVRGAWGDFLFQTFDKGEYLASAGVPYADGLHRLGRAVIQYRTDAVRRLSVFLLPPLALLSVGMGSVRGSRRTRGDLLTVLPFILAGLAMVYPRADISHFSYLAPLMMLGMAVGTVGLRSGGRTVTASLATVIVASGAIVAATAFADRWEDSEWSKIPPMGSVRINERELEGWARPAVRLGDDLGSGTEVFLLTARASSLYLIGDLRNPTPFDYPLVTQLGNRGTESILQSIRSGSITRVCVGTEWPRRTKPTELLHTVPRLMDPVADYGVCRLFVRLDDGE